LARADSLAGRVVIDTANQFGRGVAASLNGRTAARYNADRMPGAAYTKCFNTLTAGFQAEAATRSGADRVVQWIAGDDTQAKKICPGAPGHRAGRPKPSAVTCPACPAP
jgi:8-hydroxy-5-deazaflavin:NADPH oxidoreductase